ncbi:hypothetical protein CCACVL1_23758 [Corchorus capsularis]|uniref:Uncharacterized protein n=1 Tax=Corchorus capsularis TaxID=210143 RepID=A0A1R3GSL2_COCAP|nr:hypothetical protein CCACVL1_23758 [Corchorus capsularis]
MAIKPYEHDFVDHCPALWAQYPSFQPHIVD